MQTWALQAVGLCSVVQSKEQTCAGTLCYYLTSQTRCDSFSYDGLIGTTESVSIGFLEWHKYPMAGVLK